MNIRTNVVAVSASVLGAITLAAPAVAAEEKRSDMRALPACLDLKAGGPGMDIVENRCNHRVRFKAIYASGSTSGCMVIGANDTRTVRESTTRITRAGC